jgi:pimeloyl-ACP methyl ester carboxylesterase
MSMLLRAAVMAVMLASQLYTMSIGTTAEAAEIDAPARSAPPLFPDSDTVVKDRFSVEIVGHGPDLVLIPGLASPRATWKATAERLRTQYRLHLIQVSGFAGEPSRANASGPVLLPTAEAIDAYLVEAKLTPATVIAHSLGGTMGLWLAENHPEHLKKLLIVDSIPFLGQLFGGATAESVKPIANTIRVSAESAPPNDDLLARMVTAPADKVMVTEWARTSDRMAVANAMADGIVLDLRPSLAAISVPTTLLYPDTIPGVPQGMADSMYASFYAAAPQIKRVRIDQSLHFIMLDQPEKFAAALDAFLAQ